MYPDTRDNIDKDTLVLLSLGSNIGDRERGINDAVRLLKDSGALYGIRKSSFYETEPVGYHDQDWFVNIAVSGYTGLPLNNLMQCIKSIEYSLGRVIRKKWAEREIDIDILLFGNEVVDIEKITVPHPRMHQRRFVLEPAAEIAGSLIHPAFGLTINELLAQCSDESAVKAMEQVSI